MSGRSRWWGALLVWFAGSLGCSELPVPPYDAGAPPDGPPPPTTFGPQPLTPISVEAVALAADDSGIYWTSPANNLWVLAPEIPIPLPLGTDAGKTVSCFGPTAPLLSSSYAFWMGGDRATLHRTRKDGTADDHLAAVAEGDSLTSDGNSIFWTESSRTYAAGYADGSVIRTLSQDAPAGSPVSTLLLSFDQIYSLAVVDGAAYWTPAPNATIYYSDVWTGTIQALAGGDFGTKIPGLQSPYGLTGVGGDLYFGFYQDLWTTGLGRLAAGGGAEQAIATLPTEEYGATLAVADGWLFASTNPGARSCNEPPTFHLYAAPLDGGPPKLIAVGMQTPAIVAPQGIVFVDAAKHLVALPTREVAAIVSPVP